MMLEKICGSFASGPNLVGIANGELPDSEAYRLAIGADSVSNSGIAMIKIIIIHGRSK